ncbi:MAG: Kelch repeat-containing protein, partial [Thermoanaerobaculia bacterium]
SRTLCGMAYDSSRHRIVMFGGYTTGFQGLQDTWEYDGANWTQITSTNKPSRRGDVGMTFDTSRARVLLFGGRNNNTVYGDTWEYNSGGWTQRNPPSSSPYSRYDMGMAYDPVRNKTVLFGGATPLFYFNDTWEWNGTMWTQVVTAQAPSARKDFQLVYDTARARTLGHGGEPDSNETWTYNGATWTRIAQSGLPAVRYLFGMAYQPLLDAVVLYGGQNFATEGNMTDTWHYLGGVWSKQSSAGSPTGSNGLQLAFDADGSRVVGFSGAQITGLYTPDLHEYAGNPLQWASTGPQLPDKRSGYGWAYAPLLGGIVMFGGHACCILESSYYLADDTWTLQGMNWMPRLPPSKPSPRNGMGMAFHEATGKVVLYGGTEQPDAPAYRKADTWLYDGQAWQLLTQTSPPGPRFELSLAYDSARGRTVLFGDGPALEGLTWDFDGANWVGRPTSSQPDPNRCGMQIAYDSKRQIVTLFGGRLCSAGIYFNDTWAYGPDPDGDGIVGRLDNCVNSPNANQANADGDAAGDACDCAPANGGSFAQPVEVQSLTEAGIGATSLTWQDQAPLVGSAVVYDVATGSLATLHSTGGFGGAICLVSGATTPAATDSRVPPPADGFYHLVRSRNACGAGTYGPGRAALDSASPCP